MNPIAGSLPDVQALKAAQVLCLHKPHCAGVVFPEDGLAYLSHDWWFSATGRCPRLTLNDAGQKSASRKSPRISSKPVSGSLPLARRIILSFGLPRG